MSVASTASVDQGERRERPAAAEPAVSRGPSYSSVTGTTARASRTTRIREMSTSCSWPRSASRRIFTPVATSTSPKTRKTQSKAASAAAPRAMKMPRSTSAPTMP